MNKLPFFSSECSTKNNDDEFCRYLNSISDCKPLSQIEEIQLACIIKNGGKAGKDAEAKFVKANLYLVVSIAKKYGYMSEKISIVDLIQEGCIGLINAVRLFNPTAGTKFSTFAVYHIMQAIRTAMSYYGYSVHIPYNEYKQLNKFFKMQKEALKTGKGKLSLEDYCTMHNLNYCKMRAALQALNKMVYFDKPLNSNGDKTITYGDKFFSNLNMDNELSHESMKIIIDRAINSLHSSQEQEVVRMYYGLDCEELPLNEIALVIGKKYERTRQILKSGEHNLAKSIRYYLAA